MTNHRPPDKKFKIRCKANNAVWRDVGEIAIWLDSKGQMESNEVLLYISPDSKFRLFEEGKKP